jgi:hypothetical protein
VSVSELFVLCFHDKETDLRLERQRQRQNVVIESIPTSAQVKMKREKRKEEKGMEDSILRRCLEEGEDGSLVQASEFSRQIPVKAFLR